MVVQIPPGVLYLCLNLPILFITAISLYTVTVLIQRVFKVVFAPWLVTTVCVLSFPVGFSISIFWKDWNINRRAKALGAVLAPVYTGYLPGGVDMLIEASRLKDTMYPGDRIEDYLEESNHTINHRLLFKNRIFTTEPEYIKSILATNFNNYEKGRTLTGIMAPLLGTGVFNVDGERWKFHRSMTRPFFTKDRIRHFQIFDGHAQDAVSQIKVRIGQGYAIDIQDVVSRFTLDSATEFLFGTDVRSLSAGLNYPSGSTASSNPSKKHPADVFANAFHAAQALMWQRMNYSVLWPISEMFEDKIKKHMHVIRAFIDPIIGSALLKKRDGKIADTLDGEEGVTLLEHLVKLTDDPTTIRDETLNIMIAGRDTTASTLTFVVGMLAQHPDVLARLRKEILETVGSTNIPTSDDLREMSYLRAVINETLRLYPPVPFNIRYSINETVWPSVNGRPRIYVPGHSLILYSVFLMHRRKDLWGPDALKFDPNRFLDERVQKYLTTNPFIFLPFNAGPRICLGQQFAYNEISLMIIRLLQSFAGIEMAPDANPAALPPSGWVNGKGRRPEEKIWIKSHLTMYACNGCWVRMKEAEDSEITV